MPISYNIVERGEPGVEGGGETKFYASAITTGETDIAKLTRRIEKISTVSKADIQAVLFSMIDVIPEELSEGNIVRLGELGTFRVSLSSNGEEAAEEVSAGSIRKSRILFSPGPEFQVMLNNLTFKKA